MCYIAVYCLLTYLLTYFKGWQWDRLRDFLLASSFNYAGFISSYLIWLFPVRPGSARRPLLFLSPATLALLAVIYLTCRYATDNLFSVFRFVLSCRLHLHPAVGPTRTSCCPYTPDLFSRLFFNCPLPLWPCGIHCGACLAALSSRLPIVCPSQVNVCRRTWFTLAQLFAFSPQILVSDDVWHCLPCRLFNHAALLRRRRPVTTSPPKSSHVPVFRQNHEASSVIFSQKPVLYALWP